MHTVRTLRTPCILATLLCAIDLSGLTEVYFSPDDGIEKRLIAELNAATSHIHAAVFMLTSSNVLEALRAAHQRGVDVQVITDQGCIESPYSRISTLATDGIPLFVYREKSTKESDGALEEVSPLAAESKTDDLAHRNRYRSLMHHKFALIDTITWTGSYNWTKTANSSNQENAIKTDDADVYKRFADQFELLKMRSVGYRDFELIPFEMPDETGSMGILETLAYYTRQIFETIFW